jgi:hypothetical protein
VIRLPTFSLIAISKRKKQLPHIPDAQSDKSVQDLGPVAGSGEFSTVGLKDVRCQIKPS